MPVFVLIEEDGFASNPEELAKDSKEDNALLEWMVRRPLRGIQLSEPSYARLEVRRANGKVVLLKNASVDGNEGHTTSNFIVVALSEARQEKYQLLETFGQNYGFFFGERPRVIQVSAQLLNTSDFQWQAEWWHNYESFFRGTRLVELSARLYLYFDGRVVEGYMLDSQVSQNAQEPNTAALTFSIWVTGYFDNRDIESGSFPEPQQLDPEGQESRVAVADNTDEYVLRESLDDAREEQQEGIVTDEEVRLASNKLLRQSGVEDDSQVSSEGNSLLATDGSSSTQATHGAVMFSGVNLSGSGTGGAS